MVHSVVPPLELLKKWEDEILKRYENVDVQLLNAYQAGADAELEACCALLEIQCEGGHTFYSDAGQWLHTARRPKPPSLKEQALTEMELLETHGIHACCLGTLRRALESLPDPQD